LAVNEQADTPEESRVDDLERFNNRITWLLGIVVIAALLVIGFYFGRFRGELGTQEVYAQFGDYFGGVLNPLLGFATVALLVYSIRLQAKELRNTTEELRLTRDEMGIATQEAAKSAEAASSQITLMHSREKIKDATKALEIYEGRFDELLEFEWKLSGVDLKSFQIKEGLTDFSFRKLLTDYRRNPVAIIHYKEMLLKLEYVLGWMPFIDFKKEVLEITKRMAGCVCLMIELGVEFRLCEFWVERVRVLMRRAHIVGLISSEEKNAIQGLFDGQINSRQMKESSFKGIPNREVDIEPTHYYSLVQAMKHFNSSQDDT
jgi:uncharacterized membrane protein